MVLTLIKVFYTSTAAHSLRLTRKDTQAHASVPDCCFARQLLSLLLACQHNISALSVRSVLSVHLCDHSVTNPLSHVLNCPPSIAAKSNSAVVSFFSSHPPHRQNVFCQQLISLCAERRPQRLASRNAFVCSCCFKSGFSGVQGKMLVNMTDCTMQSKVKTTRGRQDLVKPSYSSLLCGQFM